MPLVSAGWPLIGKRLAWRQAPVNLVLVNGKRNIMKRQSGFTLVELLVVIVIAAILATVAIPSYREAVRRSDRRAAQAVMLDIANRERQYFTANRTFATEGELDYTLPAELAGKYTFSIDVDAGPPPEFTIDFDSIGVQAADGDLSLTSAGVKSPAEKW